MIFLSNNKPIFYMMLIICLHLSVKQLQKSNNTESILYVMLPVFCTSLVINICTITWYVNVFSKNYVLYCFELYSQKQTRFKMVSCQRRAYVLALNNNIMMMIPFCIDQVNNNIYIF